MDYIETIEKAKELAIKVSDYCRYAPNGDSGTTINSVEINCHKNSFDDGYLFADGLTGFCDFTNKKMSISYYGNSSCIYHECYHMTEFSHDKLFVTVFYGIVMENMQKISSKSMKTKRDLFIYYLYSIIPCEMRAEFFAGVYGGSRSLRYKEISEYYGKLNSISERRMRRILVNMCPRKNKKSMRTYAKKIRKDGIMLMFKYIRDFFEDVRKKSFDSTWLNDMYKKIEEQNPFCGIAEAYEKR